MTSKVCKYCGKVVDENKQACSFCGTKFANLEQDMPTRPTVDFPTTNLNNLYYEPVNTSKSSYVNSENVAEKNIDTSGSKTRDKNFYMKVLFFACMAVLVVGGGAICCFSLISSNNLKDDALASKSTMSTQISPQAKNGRNNNLGNIPENVNAGGYVLNDDDITYWTENDGVYRSNISTLDSKTKVCEIDAFGLNVYNNKMLLISKSNNFLAYIEDYSNVEDAACRIIYKPSNGSLLCNLCRYKDCIYLLVKENDVYKVYKADADNNGYDEEYNSSDFFAGNQQATSNEYKIEELFSVKAQQVWLGQSDSSIKLCSSTGTSWTVYESCPNDENSEFLKKVSGNNSIMSVLFLEGQVLVFDQNFPNKCGNACVYDYYGSRKEISINAEPIKYSASSGEMVVLTTIYNQFLWFDYSIGMIHNIDTNEDASQLKIRNLGFSQGNVCIACEDSLMMIDVNDGNQCSSK